MIRFLFRILVFAVIFVVAGELFFRFVIPASTTPFKMFNPQYGILLHDTSGARDGVYTVGRLADVRIPFHINKWGWHSSIDFEPRYAGRKPVFAMFGNSFVAGFQVREHDHVGTQLADLLDHHYDFYNFGEGGIPVSQFFNIARYARDRFNPDVYIFLLLDTDWTFSLRNYLVDPKSPQIVFENGQFRSIPATFRKATVGRLTKYSAIARYLLYNANVNVFNKLTSPRRPPSSQAKRRPKTFAEKYPLVEPAMDYLLSQLKRDLPDQQVILISQPVIEKVYAGNANCSQPTIEWLRRGCTKYGFHLLDLGPVFADDYARNARSFTFSYDYHWNPYAHRVVAEALKDLMIREHVVGSVPN